MCGTFIDEVPQDFHRERKAVSEKLLEATEQAVPIIQALTADDATADLNPLTLTMSVQNARKARGCERLRRGPPAACPGVWLSFRASGFSPLPSTT